MIAQLVGMAASLVNRKMFIAFIGIELLSINGVLSDTLGMLALTELGVQSAIVYSLYAPIATGDREQVCRIISLLKKVYAVIGAVILGLGLCLLPFVQLFFTNLTVPLWMVRAAFVLLLLSSVVTYFFGYKRTLLYADQKQYIYAAVDTWTQILFTLLKLAVVVIWHSYFVYLTLMIVQNLFSNLLIELYCRRHYGWLRTGLSSPPELKKSLFANTKDIFAGRLATYVYSSTDNLIISSLLSTVLVGYVGNYKTVTDAIKNIINNCMTPIQPIIGNYLVTESKESARTLFSNYTFLRYGVAVVLLVPTASLATLFVGLYYGSQFVMGQGIVLLIVLDLYMACLQGSAGEYVTALGYFKYDKYAYMAGAALNLLTSLVGAKLIGLAGVLLGTVVSQLVMWVGRSYILYHRFFSLAEYPAYWLRQGLYAGLAVVMYLLVQLCGGLLPWAGTIPGFILRGVVAECIVGGGLVLVFGRTPQFAYLWGFAKKLLDKLRRRGKNDPDDR